MKKKNKNTLLGDILETVTKYFLIVVAVVVLIILFSGIRVVESGNVALVLRFGKLVGENYEEQVNQPGLLFAFPSFIDEVITVPTGSVIEQSVSTHYTEDGNRLKGLDGGYLITGDQNIAVVSASVKYTITDPVAYALNVKNISVLVDAAVSTAHTEVGHISCSPGERAGVGGGNVGVGAVKSTYPSVKIGGKGGLFPRRFGMKIEKGKIVIPLLTQEDAVGGSEG